MRRRTFMQKLMIWRTTPLVPSRQCSFLAWWGTPPPSPSTTTSSTTWWWRFHTPSRSSQKPWTSIKQTCKNRKTLTHSMPSVLCTGHRKSTCKLYQYYYYYYLSSLLPRSSLREQSWLPQERIILTFISSRPEQYIWQGGSSLFRPVISPTVQFTLFSLFPRNEKCKLSQSYQTHVKGYDRQNLNDVYKQSLEVKIEKSNNGNRVSCGSFGQNILDLK